MATEPPSAESIGRRLAAAREERGLLVEEVSEATRIRPGLIRAIEAGDFRGCGGAVYARGHIRSISAVVGADAVALVADYDQVNGAPAPVAVVAAQPPVPVAAPRPASRSHPVTARAEPSAPAAAAAPAAGSGGRLVLPTALNTRRRHLGWPVLAGLALLIVIVVAAADLASRPAAHHVAQPVTSSRPTITPPSPTPTVTSTTAPSGVTADAGVNVVVHVQSQPCWISVSNQDSQVLFTGVLQPGASQSFHALASLRFTVGNAGAYVATVNGRSIGSIGPFGAVKTLTVTAAGAQVA